MYRIGTFSKLCKLSVKALRFYEAAAQPRESYIDGIWNRESSSEWLTEVQVPLRRRRLISTASLDDGVIQYWRPPRRAGSQPPKTQGPRE